MGELARKPGCPELADTPLGLLTPRPGEGFSDFDRFFVPSLGLVSGVLTVAFGNLLLKRPMWAGIYTHILAGGLGWFICKGIQESKFAARSERDAVFKHYITLHPEDFPPFKRQRIGDLYYPFKPIR